MRAAIPTFFLGPSESPYSALSSILVYIWYYVPHIADKIAASKMDVVRVRVRKKPERDHAAVLDI